MTGSPSDTITAQMLRVHGGDTEALHRLVAEHLPWIAAHVRRRLTPLLRRDGDTQDHVQEAMIDVLGCEPQLEPCSLAPAQWKPTRRRRPPLSE